MRVLFIKPSVCRLYEGINETVVEPLGLEYLASCIKKDHDVKIVDMDTMVEDMNDLRGKLNNFSPQFIGITVSTPMIREVKQIVELARQVVPEATIAIGGAHPSSMPEESLRHTGADIACFGEGEGTITELVREMPLDRVAGIAYYQNSALKVNSRRKEVAVLDSLPFPSRELVPRDKYRLSYSFGLENQRCATIITSRSCPFQCTFCASKAVFSNKVRFRSIPNVIQELEQLAGDFSINVILFVDDCFTLNERRVKELCKEMTNRRLNLKWWLDTRVDMISKDLLLRMKEAGCCFIVYGVEAGSQRILDSIGKKITVEQVRQTFHLTHEVGIDTKVNFMFGHMGETETEIWESINLARELNPTRASFYLTIPLPGSKLYEDASKKNLIKKDFSDFYWYGEPVSEISAVPVERLKELQKIAYEMVPPKR